MKTNRRLFLRNGLWIASPALLIPRLLRAQTIFGPGTIGGQGTVSLAAPPAGGTNLLEENLEGPGYDNSNANGWVEDGNPNEAYSSLALAGSYSFNSVQDGSRAHAHFVSSTELWWYCLVRYNSINDGSGFAPWGDTAGNMYTDFNVGSGRIKVHQGSSSANTTDGMVINTTYHLWMHWKNDGTNSVEFSTDGIKFGSGTKYAAVSGGDGNTNVDTIYIGLARQMDVIIDKVRVSATDPGNNPA